MKTPACAFIALVISAFMWASAQAAVTQNQQPVSTPSHAAGATRTDEHGIAQVYVPIGCFLMGSTNQQVDAAMQACDKLWGKGICHGGPLESERPQHKVCITKAYWLDIYEVTNVAFQQFINAGGYEAREFWADEGWQWKEDNHITTPNGYAGRTDSQQPQVGVNWYEASAYAKWRGGRLPTEAEWEYAARGPQSLIYPWGNTYDAGKLNADLQLDKTQPVGSYESDKSWIGAYDLAGNVQEWVVDWYSATYYQQKVQNDPTGPISGGYRSLRGGSWGDRAYTARAMFRGSCNPYVGSGLIGFRVMIPAP